MIGRALLAEMTGQNVIATDLTNKDLPDGIEFHSMDVTRDDPDRVMAQIRPGVIVHLASIVRPPKGMAREAAFAVDVTSTQNVLTAETKHGVRRIVVTSSGVACGYDADNAVPLREGDPCCGNPELPYADHKRQVAEMLTTARETAPQLEQVVLRVVTVLGAGIENQITALFRRPSCWLCRCQEAYLSSFGPKTSPRFWRVLLPMALLEFLTLRAMGRWGRLSWQHVWLSRFCDCLLGS